MEKTDVTVVVNRIERILIFQFKLHTGFFLRLFCEILKYLSHFEICNDIFIFVNNLLPQNIDCSLLDCNKNL